MIDKKSILGVGITNATKEETLEYIVKSLENFKQKLFLITPNPEFLVLASKNPAYKDVLNKADLALVDGVGVLLAGRLLGKPLKERFTGVDLVESLCEAVAEKPITVGFLGGRGNVAEKTVECLRKKYPKLKVSFVGEEWSNKNSGRLSHLADDAREVNSDILSSSPSLSERLLQTKRKSAFSSSASGQAPSISNIDILFVAFGAPKQEMWIDKNLEKIPVKIAIGVGGAFDYISGNVKRAPVWMQNIGLEWMYRLIRQPWRIKRQLALLEFIWLVLKEKLVKN